MAQIFHPLMNTVARAGLVLLVLTIGALAWGWSALMNSDYVQEVDAYLPQPVPFSHQHHVEEIGIDCRYCHTSVTTSAFAGMPPTHTCMTCHSQLFTEAGMLEPVRRSLAADEPLHWNRVYDHPDFTYFHHAIHVNQGIGCSECHGRVDQMPLTRKTQALTMQWCLECHRAPERFVRPRDQVFNMEYVQPEDQLALGLKLVEEYDIQQRTDCSTCHR